MGVLAVMSLSATSVLACTDPAKCNCKHKKHANGKKHSHHHNETPKPVPMPEIKPNPALASCNSEGLGNLVGKNKSVLASMKFAGSVRLEEPGMMYTMDYRADRLRIITDEKGMITSLMCG